MTAKKQIYSDEKRGINDVRTTCKGCCFCGNIMGAMIQLHQGWCCSDCLWDVVLRKHTKETED